MTQATWNACRCVQTSKIMIVCCLLKLGSIIFFPTPSISLLTRSLVPLSMLLQALHTAMGTCRLSMGEMHQGASWEAPRIGLSLGAGMGFSAVPHGCGYPGKLGQAPGTYRHVTAKGKQQQPEGLRGANLSAVLAQQLHGMRLGHPGCPWQSVQSPLLK